MFKNHPPDKSSLRRGRYLKKRISAGVYYDMERTPSLKKCKRHTKVRLYAKNDQLKIAFPKSMLSAICSDKLINGLIAESL